MKKLIIALLIFNSSFCMSQPWDALDAKNGFRENVFGINKSEFKNLKLVAVSSDSLDKTYSKPDEKLFIGSNPISSINYSFFRDQFYQVIIETKGYESSRGVLSSLRELYGKPFQSNRYIEEYAWLGSVATIIYTENSITNDAVIIMTNREISKRLQAAQKESAKNAKKDW